MSRFSQLYIERGARVADSQRARRRLAALFADVVQYVHNGRSNIAARIKQKQGCAMPTAVGYGPNFNLFFSTADARDVGDAVTAVAECMPGVLAQRWFAEVATILEEEHLQYRLEGGIVRPFVDAEFEANRAGALDALGEARFAQARAEFDAAFGHLRDGRGVEALRMMFPAVETAIRVLFPGGFTGLGPNEVNHHCGPVCSQSTRGTSLQSMPVVAC
jgi:hypothetical protein